MINYRDHWSINSGREVTFEISIWEATAIDRNWRGYGTSIDWAVSFCMA